jgi:uridine phosphorylase
MRDDEDREVISSPFDDTPRFPDTNSLVSEASTPLLQAKDYAAASVFRPENLLREARRQKGLPIEDVPEICILDPDGDILRQLRADGRAQRLPAWACYHTDLFAFEVKPERFGIVGCAVGASFAVLIAEQLFASGCRLLVSITSSGQIAPGGPTPYFVLIDKALRDEGTSHHYLPPSLFADADPSLADLVMQGLAGGTLTVRRGATWTTDAPYRETEIAIEAARAHGVLAVEMEAAALYAFARAQAQSVLCFAHVTNQMAQISGDFEKGEADGAHDALALLSETARAWRSRA